MQPHMLVSQMLVQMHHAGVSMVPLFGDGIERILLKNISVSPVTHDTDLLHNAINGAIHTSQPNGVPVKSLRM